ncbi:hypothetical protein Nepgr_017454 [Nepenthes gracilis]|uniref:Uncharacterized protein n=1 Tax=Nepenthes gracilis TaxID=150966 RepID=A0AAD3XSH7_NEPGR|nr:hypothetical protein Nepgr_017454 [Nepenthes gracilis]
MMYFPEPEAVAVPALARWYCVGFLCRLDVGSPGLNLWCVLNCLADDGVSRGLSMQEPVCLHASMCQYDAVTGCCTGCSCCQTLQPACLVLILIVDADGWGLDILLLPFCAAELLPYVQSTVNWLQSALGLWSLGAKKPCVFNCCEPVAEWMFSVRGSDFTVASVADAEMLECCCLC